MSDPHSRPREVCHATAATSGVPCHCSRCEAARLRQQRADLERFIAAFRAFDRRTEKEQTQ